MELLRARDLTVSGKKNEIAQRLETDDLVKIQQRYRCLHREEIELITHTFDDCSNADDNLIYVPNLCLSAIDFRMLDPRHASPTLTVNVVDTLFKLLQTRQAFACTMLICTLKR